MNTLTTQEETKEIHSSCIPVNKTEKNPVKKLVRKVIQRVKPLHCFVRWDSMQNQWAILDVKNPTDIKLIRHFDFGYMENVKFSTANVPIRQLCLYGEFIGLAEGDLVENSYGPSDVIGYKNIGFGPGGFIDADGNKITQASGLRLMGARTSLYKE